MNSPDRYQLVVLNDDSHSYLYVIDLFRRLFGYSSEFACHLAREIDETGRAVVFVGTLVEVEEKGRLVLEAGPDPNVRHSTGPLQVLVEVRATDDAFPPLEAPKPPPGPPSIGLSAWEALLAVAAHVVYAGANGRELTGQFVMWAVVISAFVATAVNMVQRAFGVYLHPVKSLIAVVGLTFVTRAVAVILGVL